MSYEKIFDLVTKVDDFVWGPAMLVLLVGTGIFLTIRVGFLTWRNLGYAIKSTLSKEARTQKRGDGDVSPFSALTTALAATIGTGNIVGVATAMVSGGPGALVWMWISACFGLTSKFSECMLAIKYRERNEKGEMSAACPFIDFSLFSEADYNPLNFVCQYIVQKCHLLFLEQFIHLSNIFFIPLSLYFKSVHHLIQKS